MKTNISGTALITGGSSGLGLEFARQLAALGCSLVLVSNREEELSAAAQALRTAYPVEVVTRVQNLAVSGAADELFQWTREEGMQIDILVSNAGMFFFGELAEDNYEKANALIGLHVETPTRLCILFGNDMKRRGHGTIISMASLAADLPVPGITLYSASKAYLKSFGKSFYHELRPYGVSITTVCPAGIATPLYGLRDDLMTFAVKIGVIKKPQWLVSKAIKAAGRKRMFLRAGLIDRLMIPALWLIPTPIETWIWGKCKDKF